MKKNQINYQNKNKNKNKNKNFQIWKRTFALYVLKQHLLIAIFNALIACAENAMIHALQEVIIHAQNAAVLGYNKLSKSPSPPLKKK